MSNEFVDTLMEVYRDSSHNCGVNQFVTESVGHNTDSRSQVVELLPTSSSRGH